MSSPERNDSRLVYTTESGRICPDCQKPQAQCTCRGKSSGSRQKVQAGPASGSPRDGVARIRREVGGRGGKTVTTITGLTVSADQLKSVAATLKKKLGTGGSVKDGVIEIQGDHRDAILAELQKQGFTCKLAGG